MVKFTHKKRHTAPDGPGPGRPRAAPRVETKRHHTHGGLAAELWANDYKSLFELEASERPEIGQMLESVIDEGASTYRQQRRGGEMAVARHQSGVAAAQLSLAAQVRRLANVRDIPLLTAARSLSWLMTMARSIHYQEERKLRRLLDRKTTMRILKSMTKLAPQTSFEINPLVRLGLVDQTYMQNQHYGSRRHVRVEQLDDQGVRVQTHFDVFINAIGLHVPSALAKLDVADLRAIVDKGPYTEDPALTLLPALQPAVVRHDQRGFVERSSARLLLYARGAGCAPSALSPVEMTAALIGRPLISPGGKTACSFLPVLPGTDTKSYLDMIKIVAHLKHHLGPSLVLAVMGDGQTVLRLRDLKKKYGAAYRSILIANGHFHSFSHFMFAGHEMFFETLTCWTAALLGKDRLSVPKLVNLENNNYYHVLEHNLSLTSAIYVFLIKHVTSPPAHLFLSSPEAYLRQLGCAGGIVLLQFLLFVGAPTLRWHYAGRAGDGDEVARLHALAVHLYRGICHKTASARISLYTLMGMHCAHPKLQQLLRATVSMSVLGRDGGNMYVDRFVEFVNFLLKKRNSCHAAFDMALQFTPHLPALMHAHAAYEAAVLGAPHVEDPIRPSTHNEVAKLVDEFIRLLGTDLTTPTADNPFWHTGQPVPLAAGEYKTRRPWEWVWLVAQGRAFGKGSASLESIDEWGERMAADAF